MDFATWVQSQIDKFDITVYQISKRSGVHASTIANWLNGAKPQDAKAKAVKIALDEIIKEKQALSSDLLPDGAVIPEEGAKKAPTGTGEREGISPAKQALLDVIDSLTDEQCEKLLIVVESAKKLL